jgi:hypothetical protein|nr:MAG TPA: hypothetical protein [Crassvirales sp.]
MLARVKVLANFKELDENQRIRDREEETMGMASTPKLEEQYKYTRFIFKLDDVKRAYFSGDGKDMILGFVDGEFTVKADEELWKMIEAKINN